MIIPVFYCSLDYLSGKMATVSHVSLTVAEQVLFNLVAPSLRFWLSYVKQLRIPIVAQRMMHRSFLMSSVYTDRQPNMQDQNNVKLLCRWSTCWVPYMPTYRTIRWWQRENVGWTARALINQSTTTIPSSPFQVLTHIQQSGGGCGPRTVAVYDLGKVLVRREEQDGLCDRPFCTWTQVEGGMGVGNMSTSISTLMEKEWNELCSRYESMSKCTLEKRPSYQ